MEVTCGGVGRCTALPACTHERPCTPTHLVVAEPDAALCNAEVDDMVEEGLALGVPLGRGERMRQHLLQKLQVRLLVKRLHTHEQRPSL